MTHIPSKTRFASMSTKVDGPLFVKEYFPTPAEASELEKNMAVYQKMPTMRYCKDEDWTNIESYLTVQSAQFNGVSCKICFLHWDCEYMNTLFETCAHPKCVMGRAVDGSVDTDDQQIFCVMHYTGAEGTVCAPNLIPLCL